MVMKKKRVLFLLSVLAIGFAGMLRASEGATMAAVERRKKRREK